MEAMTLNVRYNCNNITAITVSPNTTVKQLKRSLIKKVGHVPEKELGIIVAGHLLDDDEVIENCDIGDQSTVHAYRQKPTYIKPKVGCRKCQYYVFCKECKSLAPGKLRVQCSTCHEGAFVADRGPDGWHDISQANRISGKCQNEHCSGNRAEFYFKCGVKHEGESVGTVVGLCHIRPNSRQVACIGCGDVVTPVLVYPCEDGHVTCLECFKSYGIVKLNERRFLETEEYGYTLPCPVNCDNSLIQEIHHFCLLGEEQYERYKNFAAEEYVLKSGGLFCPAIGCGCPVYPEQGKTLKCCLCQFEFCADCRREAHYGNCSLQMIHNISTQICPVVDSELEEKARWESQTNETIRKTTKLCPHCRTPTEKNGGCSHLICTRCEYHWCWMCEVKWNPDCQTNHWFD